MKTTPISVAAAHSRKFAVHFQYLTTLVVLSVSLLCILAHNRDAHATTLGHLRSSWFHSPADSRGATDSACLRSAARLSAPGTTQTTHA